MSAATAGRWRDRTLLALVAVFAPARASSLLSTLGGPEAEPLRAAGIELASLPRRERLLALAEALEELQPFTASLPPTLASAERPRNRGPLARAWSGRGHPERQPSPALTRLLEEAVTGPRLAVHSAPPSRPGSARSLASGRRHAP